MRTPGCISLSLSYCKLISSTILSQITILAYQKLFLMRNLMKFIQCCTGKTCEELTIFHFGIPLRYSNTIFSFNVRFLIISCYILTKFSSSLEYKVWRSLFHSFTIFINDNENKPCIFRSYSTVFFTKSSTYKILQCFSMCSAVCLHTYDI